MPVTAQRSPSVVVRAWTPSDRQAVARLLAELSADARISGEGARVYVAAVDEEVVGTVTLCLFETLTGKKALLDHLVVAPSVRRCGIGRLLVQEVVRQARAAGAHRIDLTAHPSKAAGLALYDSLGFVERQTRCLRLELEGSVTSGYPAASGGVGSAEPEIEL